VPPRRSSGIGGGTGKVRLDLAGGGNADEATDLALQSDGKIVATVQARIGGVIYKHAIERLNEDGTPDAGFGSNGLATQSFAAGGDYARAVAIDAGGRIMTTGYSRTNSATSDDFLVTRRAPRSGTTRSGGVKALFR
jgi:hypothetical protein